MPGFAAMSEKGIKRANDNLMVAAGLAAAKSSNKKLKATVTGSGTMSASEVAAHDERMLAMFLHSQTEINRANTHFTAPYSHAVATAPFQLNVGTAFSTYCSGCNEFFQSCIICVGMRGRIDLTLNATAKYRIITVTEF
jgi:hypothetical protein